MDPYNAWGQTYAEKKKKRFGSLDNDSLGRSPGYGPAFTNNGRGLAKKVDNSLDQVAFQDSILDRLQVRRREGLLDKGWSYKDIAKFTGYSEDEVKKYANETRPGYGVRPSNLDKAKSVASGVVTEFGHTVGNVGDKLLDAVVPDQIRYDGRNTQNNTTNSIEAVKKRSDVGEIEKLMKLHKNPTLSSNIIKMAAEGRSLDEIKQGVQDTLAAQRVENKKLAGDTLELASLAVPVGGGARAFMAGKSALAKATAVSAAGSYAGGVGYQLSDDPNRTLVDTATDPSNLLMAGVGALFPSAGYGLRKLKVGRAIKDVTDQLDTGTLPISDYSTQMIKKSIEEKGKYSRGTWQKVSDVLKREVYDPVIKIQKSDRMIAKAEGKKLEQLIGEGRSLTEMVQKARYHNLMVNQIRETPYKVVGADGKEAKLSLADLIEEYGVGTDAERQFNRYAQNRHLLEIAKIDPKKLSPELREKIDSIQAAVDDYEKVNPNAVRDAQVKKKYYDSILDFGADLGVLNKKSVDFIKNKYPDYHPLIPQKSDDLVRPEFNGGLGFTVGRQDIVKNLRQVVDTPLETSFEGDLKYAENAIGKSLKSQIGQELERRIKSGNLEEFSLKVDPASVAAARELRGVHKLLGVEMEGIQAQLGKKVGQLRIQNAYSKPLRNRAAGAMKEYLSKTLDDPDAIAAAKNMTNKDAFDLFQVITTTPDDIGKAAKGEIPDIDKLRAKLIKRGASTQRLLDEVENLKIHYGETAVVKQDVFNQIGELGQENVKNKNILSYLKEGEVGKIELPPDWADTFSYLSTKDQRGFTAALLKGGADLQKFLYTGPGNPVFQLLQPLKNTGIMFTNGRRLSPFGLRAIGQALKPGGDFKQQMISRGYIPETFTKTPTNITDTAAKIAAKGGVFNRVKYTAQHPVMSSKDFFHSLGTLGAVLNNQQRMQVARGTYQYAKNRGFTEEQALNLAARDANEILGNFGRVSKLAQAVEPVFLYSGATQAGLRPMLQAVRDRPIETPIKLAAMASGLGGFAYANLSSDKGQEYYKDMIENGKWNNLANFVNYVFPWAEKNEKGEWGGKKDVTVGGKTISIPGVIKTPIAPDFRPLNKAVIEAAYNFTKDNGDSGFSPMQIAQEGFNFVTGGIFSSLDGIGVSPKEAIKQSGPYRVASTVFNKDSETGDEISKQNTEFTSSAGKRISALLGGRISANQVDQLLRQGGTIGSDVANDDRNLFDSYKNSFTKQFVGGKSKSNKQKAFEEKQNILRGLDEATRKRYEGRHAIERDEDGSVELGGSSAFSSIQRAGEYLVDIDENDGKDFDLEKRLAEIDNKATGKPINPIFTLDKKQAAAIFMSQTGEDVDLYKKAWYKDYQNKLETYYKAKGEWSEKQGYTWNAPTDPYPKPSSKTENKLIYYSSLPENDGPRGGNKTKTLYIKANPDVSNYFDDLRRWRNRRKLLKSFKTGVELPLEVDKYNSRPLY